MSDMETVIRDALVDGRLPCVTAHRLARDNGWTAADVGTEADRIEVKIALCQLGLFGYKGFGRKHLLRTFDKVPPGVEADLRAAASEDKIACEEVWRVAGDHGLPLPAAGCAAETLGLNIDPCQLGCFLYFKAHHK